jgi:O-antigen ligase
LSAITTNLKSASVQFWILAFFLVFVFLTGGASRGDVQSLSLLCPISIISCVIAMPTLKQEHLAGRKWLLTGFASITLLCILHIVPLPLSIWQILPGRATLADANRVAGLGEVWRPLTMDTMNGWNALASLATPLALLLLGLQLNRDDLYRLLPLLLCLGGVSGLVGMLQVVGGPQGPLYLYNITNNSAAVGLFANRNHAAVLLASLFPMLAVYASVSTGTFDQQSMRQFAAIAAGIVLVPLILVTGSRSGMLMSVPALIAAALLYRKPAGSKSDRRREAGFKLSTSHVIAAAVIVILVLLTIFFSRAEAFDRMLGQAATEDARVDYWRVGFTMIWKYFPVGSGIGSFVEAYKNNEPLSYLNDYYVNHAHNDWIEVPLTGGLPAVLILFIAVALFLFRTTNLWRRKDKNRHAVKFARLASAMIVISALASAADYPLRTPIMMAVFSIWCLWFTSPALEDARRADGNKAG